MPRGASSMESKATLDALRDAGLPLGIASSSPPHLIASVVEKLDIRDYFSVMSSAADEERGKPDPAVLPVGSPAARRRSGQLYGHFEDSVSGVPIGKNLLGCRSLSSPLHMITTIRNSGWRI